MKKLIAGLGILTMLASCSDSSTDSTTDTTSASTVSSTSLRTAVTATETATTASTTTSLDVNQALYTKFYGIGGRAFKGNGRKDLSGATVTDSINGDTTITTIDYGTTGVTDHHGNVKIGKVIVTTTGTKGSSTFSCSTTFDGYSFNGNAITGTQSSSTVLNTAGNPVSTETTDITVTLADGSGTITQKGTFTRTMTAGYSTTEDRTDDVWEETGSSTYTDATGAVYTINITTALIKSAGCKYIGTGVKEISLAGQVYTINYGDGTCDNTATVTNPDGTTSTLTIETHKGKGKHH